MAIVNDIAVAKTVAMAIDNALADATAVVIVPPYQDLFLICFFLL